MGDRYIPNVGDIISMSPNVGTGDRSWSYYIWRVIGKNELHLRLEPFDDEIKSRKGSILDIWSNGLIYIDEHIFSKANGLVNDSEVSGIEFETFWENDSHDSN